MIMMIVVVFCVVNTLGRLVFLGFWVHIRLG